MSFALDAPFGADEGNAVMLRSVRRMAALVLGGTVVLTVAAAAGPASASAAAASRPVAAPGWLGAWSANPQQLPDGDLGLSPVAGNTLRQLVHPTIGGRLVRVRVTNTFGTAALDVAGASVARAQAATSAGLVAGTSRRLTFKGRRSVSIPAGRQVFSDPVDLRVAYGQNLAIDLYVPTASGPVTGHESAQQGGFAAPGNHVDDTSTAAFTTGTYQWYWLDGVDVVPAPPAPARVSGAVVAFGDSITDGAYSTFNGNARWTDVLAARLRASRSPLSVLNSGIGGATLLHYRDCCGTSESGLDRFDRDVLAQTGAKYLITAIGINDIGAFDSSSADIIDGLTQLAHRAHARGLVAIAGTITPYGCDTGCFGPEQEATREAVNAWIMHNRVFDGYVDFAGAVADPAHPDRTRAEFDAGDHLHLNDAGYAAMGNAVDLRLLHAHRR